MNKATRIACIVAVIAVFDSAAVAKVNIETVYVGNVGNVADTEVMVLDKTTGYGSVAYEYRIGKYEVTAGQYCRFLNAAAKTDTYGLYYPLMGSNNTYGCQIAQNGASGNFTYDFSAGTLASPGSTAADWENRPVTYVSWYSAAMFANWATSGNIHQGAYDTSAAAGWGKLNASNYTGVTPHDSAEMDALVSTYGRVYVLPTEDEWYKAAYYNPTTGGYYDYATSSNSMPGSITGSGNFSRTGDGVFVEGGIDPGNYATYDADGYPPFGIPFSRTEVGEHENSASPYGTFDQGGNAWEWNEAVVYEFSRGLRGGSFGHDGFYLHARKRIFDVSFAQPSRESGSFGFRVVVIPEPATMILMAGGLPLLLKRKRKPRSWSASGSPEEHRGISGALGGLALIRRRKRGACK